MKLRPARRKKYCKFNKNKQLPVLKNDTIYTGRFNGFCVTICDIEQIRCINSMGYFGKGNLSRSFPNFNEHKKVNIIRQRQHENRKHINKEIGGNLYTETAIILNDSDSENENFIASSNPKSDRIVCLNETLNLLLEEAFFLSNVVQCLNIYDLNNILLEKNTLWELFCKAQPNFIQNYVIYHYFRARKWVVKSGLKFGGDFLLYKEGPPFYHASYLVIINVIFSHNYEQNKNISHRSFEWIQLIGLNRLTETAAKEVVICQVIWPTDVQTEDAMKSSDVIKLFGVNTVLMRRWIAKQERKSKD